MSRICQSAWEGKDTGAEGVKVQGVFMACLFSGVQAVPVSNAVHREQSNVANGKGRI